MLFAIFSINFLQIFGIKFGSFFGLFWKLNSDKTQNLVKLPCCVFSIFDLYEVISLFNPTFSSLRCAAPRPVYSKASLKRPRCPAETRGTTSRRCSAARRSAKFLDALRFVDDTTALLCENWCHPSIPKISFHFATLLNTKSKRLRKLFHMSCRRRRR